jgi:cobalt/nickel transport system permease protein
MEKTAGTTEFATSGSIYTALAKLQSLTAFLPDYGFKDAGEENTATSAAESEEAWPAVNVGTSVSGIVGGGLTLAMVVLLGILIRIVKKKKRAVT